MFLKNYKIDGLTITVNMPTAPHPNHSILDLSYLKQGFYAFFSDNDLEEEFNILIPHTLQTNGEMDSKLIKQRLDNMIKIHIKQFGRILPVDLHGYVAKSMHILYLYELEFRGYRMRSDERRELFNYFYEAYYEAMLNQWKIH